MVGRSLASTRGAASSATASAAASAGEGGRGKGGRRRSLGAEGGLLRRPATPSKWKAMGRRRRRKH